MRRICRNALLGQKWRKQVITVRLKNSSPGGNRGIAYEVLEADVLKALGKPVEGPSNPDLPIDESQLEQPSWQSGRDLDRRSDVALDRLKAIQPLIDVQPGTKAFRLAAEKISRRTGKSLSTLKRWVKAHRKHGPSGLMPKPRADKGKKRVYFSRDLDRFIRSHGIAPKTIIKGTEEVAQTARALVAEGQVGQILINLTGVQLRRWMIEQGIPEADASKVIRKAPLPREWCERAYPAKLINRAYRDNKRWSDNDAARITRIRPKRPMEVVEGDVQYLDILLPSGWRGFAIGWHDVATGRLFTTPHFAPTGQGITREAVIRSFIEMVSAWGLPQSLHLDRGSEYAVWPEQIERLFIQFPEILRQISGQPREATKFVYRAWPYSPQTKGGIESRFNELTRRLSWVKGHIGGDRLNKKTHKVGEAPNPFEGSEGDLVRCIQEVTEYLNNQRSRPRANRTPNEVFAELSEAGWQPNQIAPDLLMIGFGSEETRQVRRGSIQVSNRPYTSPELQHLPSGTEVNVWIPMFRDCEAIAVSHAGKSLGLFKPDTAFGFHDEAGKVEARRRRDAQRRSITQTAVQLPKIDTLELLAEFNRDHGSSAQPVISTGVNFQALRSDHSTIEAGDPDTSEADAALKQQFLLEKREAS